MDEVGWDGHNGMGWGEMGWSAVGCNGMLLSMSWIGWVKSKSVLAGGDGEQEGRDQRRCLHAPRQIPDVSPQCARLGISDKCNESMGELVQRTLQRSSTAIFKSNKLSWPLSRCRGATTMTCCQSLAPPQLATTPTKLSCNNCVRPSEGKDNGNEKGEHKGT